MVSRTFAQSVSFVVLMFRPLACRTFLAGLAALGALFAVATSVVAETQIVGWVERIRLGEEGVILSAKLDTGADTSSLHATKVRWFDRDGSQWVAFEVKGEDGRTVTFERKVTRIAEIKRRAGGEPLRRPTVLIGVCLGRFYRVAEVNLADRTRFSQPFLVGRSFLRHQFAVDSGRTNTIEPECRQPPPK